MSEIISAQEHAATFSHKKRAIALVIVALAFVMDLLDSTIVNVAIPAIRTNLSATFSAIQWVVAGYALTFATLLITGGRMGDVYGYKKVFLWGVAGFTVASLVSGVAVNPGMLIVARLVQGCMAALMVPQVLSLMQVMYKPEERGGVNGLFGALGGLAASLGPVLGGLLIKWNIFSWDWRPIFLINVPIGLFAIVMGIRYLPNGKSPHPLKLDIQGTLLIVTAIFLLIYPLIQGREYNWPAWSFVMMVASLPVFGAFAWWQKRKERLDGSALVLPSLFKNHSFGVGLAVNMVFEMAMISFFLTFTLLLQIGFGFTAVHSALTGLPVAFGIALTMALAGEKLIPKLGRYALTFGSTVMAIGLGLVLAVVHHYSSAVHSWQLIGPLLLVGIGMGMVFSSLFAAVLNGVDARHAGSASGTLNALQQIGGAVGVAVVGVIFFGQLSGAAPRSFTSVEPQLRHVLSVAHVPSENQTAIVKGLKTCFVDQSRAKDASVTPESCKRLEASSSTNKQLGKEIKTVALRANAVNFDTAFRWAIIYAGALLAVTFGLSFGLPRKFRAEAYAEVA
ncbi:MAG TPA: DHA2 family efflux MFS transporter permease subunit [Candidatus Saccharimonadia bacterium]|nr:DHA2 family efflux MFS transporter permease subunit [Candidatus Saccharimonadia bacterium]